jgi:hypothetical protein
MSTRSSGVEIVGRAPHKTKHAAAVNMRRFYCEPEWVSDHAGDSPLPDLTSVVGGFWYEAFTPDFPRGKP